MTKKASELAGSTTIINRAIAEVPRFEGLLQRLNRSISVLGRSELTFKKLRQKHRRDGVAFL